MVDTFESAPGIHLKKVGEFQTPPFVKRYEHNPVLTAEMMPYPSSLVFNASVVPFRGRWLMMFRNEYYPEPGVPRDGKKDLGLADSDDGIHWTPRPEFITFPTPVGAYTYDPRALQVEDTYFVTVCQEGKYGPQAVTFQTDDFQTYRVHDVAPPTTRNFTLFPEKIGGKYWRMERPFWQAVDSYCNKHAQWISWPYTIYIASSPDLKHWGDYRLLLETDQFDYANIKIGPGGAPIRTDEGWLLLIHGVDHDPTRGKNGWQDSWRNRYHGGVALLDLDDPTKVIAYNPKPFLTPEVDYETTDGWRNDVIFPMTGLVIDEELYIYYGAADTHTCLATCRLADLLAFCKAGN